MSTLVIKTGMAVEEQIARAYASSGTLILTGVQTVETLDKLVPMDCKAILSLGVCGGLSPRALVGQGFIYDAVVTTTAVIPSDPAWRKRLFSTTKYYECRCWSSGDFNTANTVAQRAALYLSSRCDVIDDETCAVAEFALLRNIAWIGMRTVSDGAEDNLPPAVLNALNPNGTDNILDVAESVFGDLSQLPDLVKTAEEAQKSFDELRTACIAVGPTFQWAP